jgi:hypothetical protein
MILQESKAEINQTSGVFPPMAGDQKGGLSGLAIHSLVEQGTQTLAEINDNYTWARREVGDHVLELVKFDNRHEQSVTVGEGKTKKEIHLNTRTWDNNTGMEVTKNNVAASPVKLILDDVPSTPAWRQQQSSHLAEITKSLPPQLQAFVVPFYMEATDIKDRKKIARILRQQMGIPEDGAEGEQQPIPTEVQAQLDQYQAAIEDLTQKAEAALREAEQLRLANANKEGELKVKAAAAAAKAEVDQQNADTKAAQAAATIASSAQSAMATQKPEPAQPAADPAAIASQVQEALEPAIDELTETVRALAKEMDQRFKAQERAAPAP